MEARDAWEMDNDILIDQAPHHYAALSVEQNVLAIDNKARFDRLDHLVTRANSRYQRRLNHCVLCYQHQIYDGKRDGRSRCKKQIKALEGRPPLFQALSGLFRHNDRKVGENYALTRLG